MRIRFVFILLSLVYSIVICAQSTRIDAKDMEKTEKFLNKYTTGSNRKKHAPVIRDYKIDNKKRTIRITVGESFALQELSPKTINKIYKGIHKRIGREYRNHKITIFANGLSIDNLAPNIKSDAKKRLYGKNYIDYKGNPWVKNVSEPITITHGLQNRHISIWASHGRYYDNNKALWKWQRPKLFGTTEDLFTQTIVVPYLIPMLENAGAVVFTPRERDWQKNEIIVDNDDFARGTNYIEINSQYSWQDANVKGFAQHTGHYTDGENPFTAGTVRKVKTTKKSSSYSLISYQPKLPQEGRYAVYVSYQTLSNSVDDACYIVWHKGEKTVFRVNQRMGGGTWVYLGTFDFDKGSNEFNRVVVTNQSTTKGVVTSDAVRFGGGMGNIMRGTATSGLPRCLEGARYYAQWAGMPYSVYSTKCGTDDYRDDINTRSLMTNYLGGGSCYIPDSDGLNVPLELSLAVHSDAGYAKNGTDLIGSLSICTTGSNNGMLKSGISRLSSFDFAKSLLTNITRDIRYKHGKWVEREVYDRNYSETRIPEIPSAIIETMSHQSFPDMRYGQDPNFKFTLARSLYKSVLRQICNSHDRPYIVTPMTPNNFRIEFTRANEVKLTWDPVEDPQEATSQPTGYIIYTSVGTAGFDNGTYIKGANHHSIELEPGILYSFKVAATNRGGKSFTTETLCALYNTDSEHADNILIVDGFHRLSSPAIRDNISEQGFDFDEDPGVSLGPTAGWVGRQICYNRDKMGIEDESGLGWSGDEFAGVFIAGNNRDHVRTHAEAIQKAGRYNIVSCSSEAIEAGKVDLSSYKLIDIILGLERNDGHSLKYYKTFPQPIRDQLQAFTKRGGALFVSGAYIGSDMTSPAEQSFLRETLKCNYAGYSTSQNDFMYGMGSSFPYYNSINEEHYAATRHDTFTPYGNAYAALCYNNGGYAAIAYKGSDYRTFTMGVPFECIMDDSKKFSIMKGIMNFLIK
ncbi:MAG: xanthan lyase [Prevotella sp.]|nr:xanthan lyase [Prevotella sp.]